MGKKLLHMALAVIAAVLPTIPSMAQIPEGYYSSLKGKKGAELKTAVYNVIKNAKVLSYGSKGDHNTWWGFWLTDRDSRGYFIDRYSAESSWVKSTSQGAVGSGMNIEHSFPKSWWGGANNQAYKDLYNLMEYVWGDSTDIAFNPETTVKSSAYKDGGGTVTPAPDPTPDEPQSGTIFTADFTKSQGGCTERIIKNESSYSNIWLQTSDYGWKATAYEKSNKKNNVADATLILPETDLTDYQSATLTINQAVNFAKTKGLEYLSIEAITIDDETDDEITTKLADFKVPSEDSWAFATYTLDLTQFCGDRLILAFHYTSDASVCCTWEIKNLTIEGTKVPTSIDTPTWKTDNHGVIDFSKPYETYTVDGMKTTLNKNKKGIFIIKQGNATRKMVRY